MAIRIPPLPLTGLVSSRPEVSIEATISAKQAYDRARALATTDAIKQLEAVASTENPAAYFPAQSLLSSILERANHLAQEGKDPVLLERFGATLYQARMEIPRHKEANPYSSDPKQLARILAQCDMDMYYSLGHYLCAIAISQQLEYSPLRLSDFIGHINQIKSPDLALNAKALVAPYHQEVEGYLQRLLRRANSDNPQSPEETLIFNFPQKANRQNMDPECAGRLLRLGIDFRAHVESDLNIYEAVAWAAQGEDGLALRGALATDMEKSPRCKAFVDRYIALGESLMGNPASLQRLGEIGRGLCISESNNALKSIGANFLVAAGQEVNQTRLPSAPPTQKELALFPQASKAYESLCASGKIKTPCCVRVRRAFGNFRKLCPGWRSKRSMSQIATPAQ